MIRADKDDKEVPPQVVIRCVYGVYTMLVVLPEIYILDFATRIQKSYRPRNETTARYVSWKGMDRGKVQAPLNRASRFVLDRTKMSLHAFQSYKFSRQ